MDRIRALEKRYIEHNGPRLMRWAAFDVDRPGGAYDWQFREAPAPNISIENRDNGHAHLLYGLAWPVLKTDSGSLKALRYAGAVEAGLRAKLEADPGYSGLTCKNPLHLSWHVETWQEALYDLDWLADYVDLSIYSDRRRHLPLSGWAAIARCSRISVTGLTGRLDKRDGRDWKRGEGSYLRRQSTSTLSLRRSPSVSFSPARSLLPCGPGSASPRRGSHRFNAQGLVNAGVTK
jgi:hypothetical protein